MSSEPTIPRFVDMATMAKWLGWSRSKTTKFFVRHGYAIRLGGKLYVSRITLRDQLPDVYMALLELTIEEGALALLDSDDAA